MTAPPTPTIRLRPAPACDPPYDDERHPEAWAAPMQPPLALNPGQRRPGPDQQATPGERHVPGERHGPPLRPPGSRRGGQPPPEGAPPAAAPAGTMAPQATALSGPSPTRTVAARFVHTCLEIVNGLRPVNHARALASPLAAGSVQTTISHATRRLQRAAHSDAGRGGTHRGSAGRRAGLVKLRRMRTCQPRPGVIEIAAVIGTGERVWAATFRLERRNGQWQCTAAAVL